MVDPNSGQARQAVTSSPCDLNNDGAVNSQDSQLAINAALGLRACGNGDLNGDGRCDAIDAQRVIYAVLTGVCRTGQ